MATTVKAQYIEAVGRRKTSVARVRITPSTKTDVVINDRSLKTYFVSEELQKITIKPLAQLKAEGETEAKQKFTISVKVNGGGIHSQAEAVAHGIARALILNEPEVRTVLKKAGALTRDSRMKERRKFGLKKARKAPQWSKR